MGRTVFCNGRGIDVNTTSRSYPCGGVTFAFERVDSDPIGSYTLRLQNIVSGSSYRVESVTSGIELATGTASGTTVDITLNQYPSGNERNTLKIKVRKGTSNPKYKPFESQASAARGTVLVWIQQEADLIA